MIQFSVGNRWEGNFLRRIFELNDKYASCGTVVNELYGSLRTSEIELLSVRPDFRLPEVNADFMKDYIKRAHRGGIKINYTVNAPFCQSIQSLAAEKDNIENIIKRLANWGVDVFTVANTLLFEIISNCTEIPLEISSVLHVRSIAQVPIYRDWGAAHICMDTVKNRDIGFLKSFHQKARENNLTTKLLTNEFCTVGGVPCAGLYQADCVQHSAMGGNKENLFNGWPFQRCVESRIQAPSAWLKSRFILPQWLDLYKDTTGISNFKITGRTCDTKWLLGIIEAYMKKRYEGDIRKLWIDPGNSHLTCKKENERNANVLSAKFLEQSGFIDFWFKHPNFRCDEHCDYDCDYCDEFFQKSI